MAVGSVVGAESETVVRRHCATVMTRYPSALTIPFKPWCNPQGYFLMGLDKLWQSTGDSKYYDYILNWANEVRYVSQEGRQSNTRKL